jgi:hypothetical protein
VTSELESVAERTRALKVAASGSIVEWDAISKGAHGVSRQAASIGRAGVDVGALVRLLDGATKDAQAAARAVTEFTAAAEAYAGRLAGARGGGAAGLACVWGAVPQVAVGAAMIFGLVTSAGQIGLSAMQYHDGNHEQGKELFDKSSKIDITDAALDPGERPRRQRESSERGQT